MDDDTLRARGLCYFILGATEVWERGQAGAELQWIKSTALGGEPELGEVGTRSQAAAVLRSKYKGPNVREEGMEGSEIRYQSGRGNSEDKG